MQRIIKQAQDVIEALSSQTQEDVDKLVHLFFEKAVAKNVIDSSVVESPLFKWAKEMKTVGEVEINNEYNIRRIATPAGVIASRLSPTSASTSAVVRILMAVKTRCPMIFTYPSTLKTEVSSVMSVCNELNITNIFFHEMTDSEFVGLTESNLIHDYLDESFLTTDLCPDCYVRSHICGKFLRFENKCDMTLQGIASFKVPARVLFKAGCTSRAIFDAREYKKVFIITDYATDYSRQTEYIEQCLSNNGMQCYKFTESLVCKTGKPLNNCVSALNGNKPNLIIALGSPEVISFAKVARLLYENPSIKVEDFDTHYSEFMRLPVNGTKTMKSVMMTIPNTYDSSALTPFAYINVGSKCTQIATEDAIPQMTIIDPDRIGFDMSAAFSELINSIESHCSIASSVYTDGLAIHAAEMLINPRASDCPEKVANASAICGLAAGSTFYGLTKAFAEELFRRYQVPEQVTMAAAFPHTLEILPKEKLQEVATSLGLNDIATLMKSIHFSAGAYRVAKLGDYVTKESLAKEAKCIAFHIFRNKHTFSLLNMPTMRDIERIVRKLL